MSQFENVCKAAAAVSVIALCTIGCGTKKEIPQGAIKVNGEWIRQSDLTMLEEAVKNEMVAATPDNLFGGAAPEYKKIAARQVIAQKLLAAEAKKMNLSIDTAMVAKNIDMLKKRFPDEKTFEAELARSAMTLDALRDQMKEGLLLDTLMKVLMKDLPQIPDDTLRQVYKQNQSKFSSKTKQRISQVILAFPKSATADQKKTLRAQAAKVLADCKAGKDFDALAKAYSQGPGAGDIGWFEKGTMSEVFEKAVADLKTGGISGIIETPIGYHILKKTDEKMTDPEPFEKVKQQIAITMEMKRRNDFMHAHVDGLLKANTIVYADTSYRPAPEVGK